MSQLRSDHPVFVAPTTNNPLKLTVTNGGTVYYGTSPRVSSAINDGNVTAGSSVVLVSATYLVSASSSEVEFSPGANTAHVGAQTPTAGRAGDVVVGNGKIWANDGGVWKSVAIA